MTDETPAEILSGQHDQSSRADLHAALDELLDDADANSGQLDGPAFWGFVAGLARGRGIADDIAEAAANHMAERSALANTQSENPAAAAIASARMAQWAMLAALLRRVTAFPGEIVPGELQALWFIAAADNIVSGAGAMGGGEHIDLLGLGTQRGSSGQAMRRAARRLLVGAVWFEAARNGGTVHAKGKARIELLQGKVSGDTFKGWVREVAKATRRTSAELWGEIVDVARQGIERHPYALTADEIGSLLIQAHWASG